MVDEALLRVDILRMGRKLLLGLLDLLGLLNLLRLLDLLGLLDQLRLLGLNILPARLLILLLALLLLESLRLLLLEFLSFSCTLSRTLIRRESLSLSRMLTMILLSFLGLIQLGLWLILLGLHLRGQRVPRAFGRGATSLLSRGSSAGIGFPLQSRLLKHLTLRLVDALVLLLPLSLAFRVCCDSVNPFV